MQNYSVFHTRTNFMPPVCPEVGGGGRGFQMTGAYKHSILLLLYIRARPILWKH